MQDQTARAVAFIAGRLATGSRATSVLDVREDHRTAFTGEVSSDSVAVYDADARCRITGRVTPDESLWLFHEGTMRPLSLESEGPSRYLGFDHASNHAFDLSVDGSGVVRLLDWEDGVWREYQL